MGIKSIEKGWGESSTFFSTDVRASSEYFVDRIVERTKKLGRGLHGDIEIKVYDGFKNGRLIFTIYAGSDVTIIYK